MCLIQFTPLLPSITVGTIDPRRYENCVKQITQQIVSITEAVRLLKGEPTAFKYYEASCTDIDHENNMVVVKAKSASVVPQATSTDNLLEFKVPYDHLIVAVGAINKLVFMLILSDSFQYFWNSWCL